MDSKKKMVIALGSFALIILAAVVAVFAVLAAQTVTINSSIKVSYTSSEVAGVVTAKYQVANGTATNIGTTGQVEFSGDEADGATETLKAEKLTINLTKQNNYVDFIFTFTNTGAAAYTATLTMPTATNFKITYTVPTTGGASKVSDTSFTLAGNTTSAVTYKVRLEVQDISSNASIDGIFAWNLVAST